MIGPPATAPNCSTVASVALPGVKKLWASVTLESWIRSEALRGEGREGESEKIINGQLKAICQTKAVERIVLITNDTDCVPAMKYGRRAGLQVVLIEMEGSMLASELPAHADFIRPVLWPS